MSDPTALSAVPPAEVGTPWGTPHPHHLEPIVWADVAGLATHQPVTRAEAMAVPALARARNLLAGTIAGIPLRAVRGEGEDVPLSWLDRSDGIASPFQRMLHTTDDLLFYGISLWGLRRDFDGNVVRAAHVPMSRWTTDTEGYILIDGEPVSSREVCVIPGIHEGILTYGRTTIRHAGNLIRHADKAVENPNAYIELHQESDAPMTEPDIEKLVNRWVKARRGDNGGVAFTNKGIRVIEHGSPKELLLTEGRNAAAIDIARLTGLPASLVDAAQSGTSVTYQNSQARMAELVTFGLAPIMGAIVARLGQDDIVARGTRVEFDLENALAALPTSVGVPDDGGPTPPPPAPDAGGGVVAGA
ncbi:portal protein [Gordonia phage EricDab]|uniref:Portal protein n=1 Tax=Gordonia phage EricDab TaxID=3070616 RepID=A0A4D6E566_9CAUD|nr:portal protein [Gordonia phage EricDab]QBZ73175.1 portal protein [Gordonia phage EricDab]